MQQGINVSVCLGRGGMRLTGFRRYAEVCSGDVQIPLADPRGRTTQQGRHRYQRRVTT